MSEQAPEAGAAATEQGPEVVELPAGDGAFGALMDALAAEPAEGAAADAAAGEGGQAAAPAADGADGGAAGQPAAGAAGSAPDAAGAGAAGAPAAEGGAGGAAGQPAAAGGADGGDPQQPAAGAGGGAPVPAEWTASAAEFAPKLGELSTKFEENFTRKHHETSLAEVQKDHPRYFEMLQKHPYMLTGQQVPRLDGQEGMETLRDAEHAKQWQDAVKHLLVEEVRDRTTRALEGEQVFLDTVHQSIKLFQDNADLIPGTKDFDVDLANRFATIAKPYEVREDGKLRGYGIPVQPLIDQLRTQIQSERAAKTAAGAPAASTPAAPSGSAPAAPAGGGSAAPSPAADQPQAGIPSKAGSSDQAEDFSTLFGTINPELRGMRI